MPCKVMNVQKRPRTSVDPFPKPESSAQGQGWERAWMNSTLAAWSHAKEKENLSGMWIGPRWDCDRTQVRHRETWNDFPANKQTSRRFQEQERSDRLRSCRPKTRKYCKNLCYFLTGSWALGLVLEPHWL